MATLNTLRTRGALILTIVIGLALIAFLLQDLTRAQSVLFNRRNRVGVINGTSIDYKTFVNANDNLSRIIQSLYGRNSLSAEEMDRVREMVWESFLREYSYDPGFQRLGLMVGEDEQVDMIKGQYVSPVITAMFTSPETGMYNPRVVESFVANLDQDKDGHMSSMWDYIKGEMNNERISSKFLALVQGGINANALEIAHGIGAANEAYGGRYVSIPFSQVPDSLVKVTSAEIRRFYNENKAMFKQDASREIEYVVFDLSPSAVDYAEAAGQVDKIATEFAAAESPMQYASLNSQGRTDARFYREDQLSPEQAAIAFGARRGEMAGPTLSGDVYTMARVAEERMMPDSVGARHILLDRSRAASADSLVKAIKGGKSIFDLAPLYSKDPTVDLGMFAPETMVEPFAEAIMAARPGDVFTVETQYGVHVVEMTYKAAPVKKVQIATITYSVEPSAATQQNVYNQARDFLTAAVGSRENFDNAVAQAGISKRVATILERDRSVRGLNDSRELVRWSYNNKPGTVSTIMEIDGDYVVSVLTGAKEAGTAAIRDVSTDIAQRIRTDKKAEILRQQLAGKTLEEAAALAGAVSGELADVKFSSFYIPDLGVEPAVIGALASIPAGTVSKPIQGLSGMYLVAVDSVDHLEDATEASEKVRIEALAETALPQRIGQALVEETEIEDNRAKFF